MLEAVRKTERSVPPLSTEKLFGTTALSTSVPRNASRK